MSRTSVIIALGAATLIGCATTPGPEDTAKAYARALAEGRVDDAYALVAPSQKAAGLSREAYARRYAKPEVRTARSQSVEKASGELTATSGALTLVRDGNAWRVVESVGDGGARKVLEAFVAAADAGDFETAYGLLSARLRSRYTPKLLARDFKAEPLAKERLERARAAATAEPVIEGIRAQFPIGEGKAVSLELEQGGYRVTALE